MVDVRKGVARSFWLFWEGTGSLLGKGSRRMERSPALLFFSLFALLPLRFMSQRNTYSSLNSQVYLSAQLRRSGADGSMGMSEEEGGEEKFLRPNTRRSSRDNSAPTSRRRADKCHQRVSRQISLDHRLLACDKIKTTSILPAKTEELDASSSSRRFNLSPIEHRSQPRH